MSEAGTPAGKAQVVAPVDFFSRFTNSDQFQRVFQEGMNLVEDTANYLDGPGRRDARLLDRHGAIAYATESMRLTTRLMQMASWLLLQRAVSQGELTLDSARSEKHRINLADIGAGTPLKGGEQLPGDLLGLVERSLRLLQRIETLDQMLSERRDAPVGVAPNPVAHQLNRLMSEFHPPKRNEPAA
jgi:regulator of CtrA degradation